MTEKIDAKVRAILDNYLESNKHRRTPERYAILDAVYSIGGHFSLEELNEELEKRSFRVSRATLYNTMHLFIELRLVMRHSLVSGMVTEIYAPAVTEAVNETKLTRFRKDTYALYIYGVCSSCQAKITRKRNEK